MQRPDPQCSDEPVRLWEWLLGRLGGGTFVVSMNVWPYLHYRSSVALQARPLDSSERRP